VKTLYKVFEYGLLKDGAHRLAKVPGVLVHDAEIGPVGLYGSAHLDKVGRREILGEVHDLSKDELYHRDWLYSAFDRIKARTTDGEVVYFYSPREFPLVAVTVARGLWLLPRQGGQVYRIETSDRAVFEGSLREILEQLYLDQWTVDGRGRFKAEVARRIRVLGGRKIRTETLVEFFRDLAAARAIRLRRIWPTKPGPVFPN
jgi:hypothetical protein